MVCAWGICSSTGIVARKIGTAPRRPTHEMKPISPRLNFIGAMERITAMGRETNISTAAMMSEGTRIGSSLDGLKRRPIIKLGRASGRERGEQYVKFRVGDGRI